MKEHKAICIVVDGLRASALGTYGNTTHPTPFLDRMAGQSLVAEWMLADSLSKELFYRSVWHRLHALRSPAVPGRTSALELLSGAGIEQVLLTDEPWLAQHTAESPIDETHCVDSSIEKAAESIGETALAGLMAEVVSQLTSWSEDSTSQNSTGQMLWVHARGMLGPWDAPQSLRQEMLDEEEDPAPADYLWPPDKLADLEDPDELLVHRAAYAAQVAVLDGCIGALLATFEELEVGSDTLVMLVGSRGFGLGEHGQFGVGSSNDGRLYSEQLHVPWLLHLPGGKHVHSRLTGLWQPADIGATLLDWLGVRDESPWCDGRSVAAALGGQSCEEKLFALSGGAHGELALRIPAWMLHTSAVSQQEGIAEDSTKSVAQLHAKPDDRWEFNDIAIRCPQVVQEMETLLECLRQQCRTGQPLSPGLLSAELLQTTL